MLPEYGSNLMKRVFPYSLLTVLLMLCIVSIGINADTGKETVVLNEQDSYFSNSNSDSLPVDYYTASEGTFSNVLNRVLPARVLTTATKTVSCGPFYRLNQLFSCLTHQRLCSINSLFTTHYSLKAKNGYYIYALRKLLI